MAPNPKISESFLQRLLQLYNDANQNIQYTNSRSAKSVLMKKNYKTKFISLG